MDRSLRNKLVRGALTVTDVARFTMSELEDMTREQVDALPDDARTLRRDRMGDDDSLWSAQEIATAAGCTIDPATGMASTSAPKKWRNNYLKTGQVGKNALPPPANEDMCKKPGDARRAGRGVSPVWAASTIRDWLQKWGRSDEDHFPMVDEKTGRTGRKAEGRPPGTGHRQRARAAALLDTAA